MNVYNRRIFCLLFTLITYASGFSRGPPSFLVCSSLTPAHIGIGFSKQGASLKTSIIDHTKGLIKVSLSASKPFKGLQTLFCVSKNVQRIDVKTYFFFPLGFIIQARDAENGDPIGQFSSGRLMTCSGSTGNTISHSSADDKTSVNTQWQNVGTDLSKEMKKVCFKATVVYSYLNGEKLQSCITFQFY